MKTIATLIIVVVFASLLSACSASEALNFAASAATSNDSPASAMTLNASPRIGSCDFSSKQLLKNAMNAEEPTGSIGEWLDSKIPTFACIAQ